MKSSTIFAPLALAAVSRALTVSFDPAYDNAAGSLTTVACSDGSNGLINRGFNTFGQLPKFPFIGGVPAITGFNSASCGTCWNLTFVNSQGVSKSVSILGIDVATPNFNIALGAMNALTNNQAQQLGRVTITAANVPASVCGLT
ncbi:cerato-platanin-related secreted protein [Crassisporium funariophilum]|nr:cerato-platanin-related secreted protein [Crassisporium funariophilum]